MTEQRRLAAIVSADMVGFSRRVGQDERGTLAALKTLRHNLIDPKIQAYGGRIVKTTGDGLLLEFPSVVDAVNCAVEVQSAMAERNADVPVEGRIEFRIGVNLGDIIIDGDDIFGDGVNVAARLQSIAPPGGVLLSQNVINSIGNNVAAAFRDAGAQRLKNIARPLQTYRWLPTGYSTKPRNRLTAARKLSVRPAWAVGLLLTLAVGGGGYWLFDRLAQQPTTVGASLIAAHRRAPVPVSDRASVAVLPFINQSGDASQEYFSDGLAEDVIVALGRFRSLTVMSRSAVFPYKGKSVKPAEIGRELGVRYLVEASVRRAAERVRVDAQLTEAVSGKLLWSEQYDFNLRDVFAVQDEIARKVCGALAVNLTRVEQQQALAKPIENLDAYDLVLRGRERLWRGTRAGNREARQILEQAIQLDPEYAAAYAWLGRTALEVANQGWTEDWAKIVDRALELGKKALALDADDVEGLSVVGSAHALRSEYDLALAASDRLLAINPSDADAMFGRLDVLLWLGRIDEAVPAGEEAYRVNPNPRAGSLFTLGLAYYQAKRNADAVRVLERGVARFPNTSFLYAPLAAAYAQMNRLPEAAQSLDSLRRLNPFFDVNIFGSRFRNPAHQEYLREGIIKAGWQ
jgi:TolB-like protein/class 3 adenylate cyclase